MGSIWAAAWFGAGMVLLLIVGLDAADVPFPLGFGFLGFLAGVTFAGVRALIGIRRPLDRFDEASIGPFVLSGGLAGLLFAVGFVYTVGALGAASLDLLEMAVVFSVAGAASAAASLALARWGERRGLL
ncbi:MAG: hypothetical protein ACOC8K_01290 [Gemmatimonadota bacterium]